MKEKLLAFLRLMEQLVPCPGQHHAITFCQFGSDVVGWEENLGLHMRLPGNKTMTWQMFNGHEGRGCLSRNQQLAEVNLWN